MVVLGEFKRRIALNRERLSAPEYRAPLIFEQGSEWPGDWQGRALLALVKHYELAEVDSVKHALKQQMDDIIDQLHSHLNADGYFGELLDLNRVNEQQISGHSWFLRALSEYHTVFKDTYTFRLIEKIIETYLLKLTAAYETYPEVERETGDVDGHLAETVVEHWHLSSDVGCAFILLDGVTHVYEITRDQRLVPLIQTMIDRFLRIDYVGNHCQTHATLSATRGMMRYYSLTKNEALLETVRRIFELYLKDGMTINYANVNWFGKPFWTEPCAVVDSFMLAKQLYAETHEFKYVQLMNRIYNNALLVSQRDNGGAGCETCLLKSGDSLEIHMYEAYFCCTMRLAEGLYEVRQSMINVHGDDLEITLLNDFSHYKSDRLEIHLKTTIGSKCHLSVSIDNPEKHQGKLKIYLPKGIRIVSASDHYEHQTFLEVSLDTKVFTLEYIADTIIESNHGTTVRIQHDHLLLKKDAQETYSNMTDYTRLSKAEALKDRRRL